jgi:hypothetical protein
MPEPADFGGFYYYRASNPLAYCAVTAAICQLRELPTFANRIEAKKSAGSEDHVLTSMGALLYGPL